MKADIQTDLEKVYTKFAVDDSVITWLKDSVEIIFDITQKAVQDNRFEIVDSGLNNITEIANEYIEARKDYSTEQDGFLTCVYEKLLDVKNLVGKDSHPKIMLSVARTAKDIAISSLEIKPIRASKGENFIPLGFINLLSSICLSPEILKDTSYAPMSTIDFLVEIAKVAIQKDFPRTATLVTDKLGNIAVVTAKLHFLYGDIIAAKANWGLASVFDYMLAKQNSSTLYLKYELISIWQQIDKSITTYLEDDIKHHYVDRNNIKTFFAPLAEHGLASVFIRALQWATDKGLSVILDVLEDFIVDINQNVMKGMDNSKYLDVRDIIENLYLIGMVFASVAEEKKEPRFQMEMTSLLRTRFYLPFTNAISMSFKHDENRYTIFYDDYIHLFFSLMGIIFYENKKHLFDSALEEWADRVIGIIQRYKTQTTGEHEGHIFEKYEIIHPLSDLYKHLRLMGVWFNHFLPKSETLKRIIGELKTQPDITISQGMYGERTSYPKDFIAERWIVERPFLPFRPHYFAEVDAALYNEKIVNEFEKKMAENAAGGRKRKK